MRHFGLIVGVMLLAANTALAAEMPAVDLEALCQAYAKQTRADLAAVTAFCVRKNEEAKSKLVKVWASAGEDVQHKCIAVSGDQPFPYPALLACVGRGHRG